jgi:hypothetical protein
VTRAVVVAAWLVLGALASGCAHECEIAAAAVKSADVACARAGVKVGDPVLLTRCAEAYYSQRAALISGACGAKIKGSE